MLFLNKTNTDEVKNLKQISNTWKLVFDRKDSWGWIKSKLNHKTGDDYDNVKKNNTNIKKVCAQNSNNNIVNEYKLSNRLETQLGINEATEGGKRRKTSRRTRKPRRKSSRRLRRKSRRQRKR